MTLSIYEKELVIDLNERQSGKTGLIKIHCSTFTDGSITLSVSPRFYRFSAWIGFDKVETCYQNFRSKGAGDVLVSNLIRTVQDKNKYRRTAFTPEQFAYLKSVARNMTDSVIRRS